MKQYIMGMLTGVSLILCAFMFMGTSNGSNVKYQFEINDTNRLYLLNTTTGQMYKDIGHSTGLKWIEISAKEYLFKDKP